MPHAGAPQEEGLPQGQEVEIHLQPGPLQPRGQAQTGEGGGERLGPCPRPSVPQPPPVSPLCPQPLLLPSPEDKCGKLSLRPAKSMDSLSSVPFSSEGKGRRRGAASARCHLRPRPGAQARPRGVALGERKWGRGGDGEGRMGTETGGMGTEGRNGMDRTGMVVVEGVDKDGDRGGWGGAGQGTRMGMEGTRKMTEQ